MIAASEPITHERALTDLRLMLYAAQHARSVMAENGWLDDDVGKRVMADCAPWLFDDERNIVLPLSRLIDRCVANGGRVQPIDYYNFLIIAQKTPPIAVGCMVMHERIFAIRTGDCCLRIATILDTLQQL